MLRYLSSLFRPNSHRIDTPVKPDFDKNHSCRYTFALADELEREHEEILNCLVLCRQACLSGRYSLVPKFLADFRSILFSHLIKERTILYQELKSHISDDDTLKSIRAFKHEMELFQGDLTSFILKWREEETVKSKTASFLKELNRIGKALVFRFAKEKDTIHSMHRLIPQISTAFQRKKAG
ncbi:hypothetical protein HF888_16470 (plasmid) [Bermanella marisrubri]|uniref:Hemerythrin-like domain-containing protein n=1 Tax=Bermanella marisrubri TaxID=207949 RepID=Q1MY12_9GAMM|nr:hypothetical protein [Bermanella marisrubri]EAT10884.1 hypothetical protein RED65_02058 [Oceanobacter sp. RED65] [Bermanella marisrubri]QIZ85935.1 hypothetical protein HF888_16470 [Bermanella marisrubri]